MLALLGVGIPQGKARVVERRRLRGGVGEQRDARRGLAGVEAADEELERRHRGRAATAAALGAAISGTMRRPTRAAIAKQVARGPRSTISSAMNRCPRESSARAAPAPPPWPRRGRRDDSGADHAGQPDHGGVAEEWHVRHSQPLHRLQPILATDGGDPAARSSRVMATDASSPSQSPRGSLLDAWNGMTSGRGPAACADGRRRHREGERHDRDRDRRPARHDAAPPFERQGHQALRAACAAAPVGLHVHVEMKSAVNFSMAAA
jgi:hypothetical protein